MADPTVQQALGGGQSWLDVLIGSGVQQQAAQQADALAGRQLQLNGLTGYVPGSSMGAGGSGYINTLSRDQFDATLAEAQRGYALDVARFGLAQADLNFRQRSQEAQQRLQEQALLVGQRGPENAIGYNYLLNNRAAPTGTEKPQGSSGISQPSNIQVPTTTSAQAVGTATRGLPTIGIPGQPVTATASGPQAAAPAADDGARSLFDLNPQEAQTRFDAYQPGGAYGFTAQDQQNTLDSFKADNPQYASYYEANHFAKGGVLDGISAKHGPAAVVGDSESGARTGNEELAKATIVDGKPRLIVMPIPDDAPLPREPKMAAGGVVDPTPVTTGPSYLGGAGMSGGTANTAYSQQEVADSPVSRQARGVESTPRFGAFGGDTTLPGTDTKFPSGAEFRVDTYADMLPSSRALLQSIVSSPREMGGLGLDFTDFLESSRRAAPIGRRFGSAVYG